MESENPNRWHPVLIRALVQCLKETFVDGYYADKVLERAFKQNRKWGSRDRRFLAETVYDMTRWWGLLAFFDKQPFAISETRDLIRRWAFYEVWKNKIDPTPFLRKHLPEHLEGFDPEKIKAAVRGGGAVPAVWDRVSFPEWLYKAFLADYGDGTPGLLAALNEPAPVFLRANGLKTDRDSLIKRLATEEVDALPVPDTEMALMLRERKNVFITKAFKEGLFEVQDRASQRVALYLAPKPGERIADVCAGAGGKTLHLSALMKSKGTLWACDVSQKKLEQLKIRARRAGVSNLRIQMAEGAKTVKRQAENFDGVLVDVPCTGTGVIRRNPDTKWKLKESEMQKLFDLQEELLNSYSRLVKKGGRLVYSTCSLLSVENEKQIEKFLQTHPDFKIDGGPSKTRPDVGQEDGFFMQRLLRTK